MSAVFKLVWDLLAVLGLLVVAVFTLGGVLACWHHRVERRAREAARRAEEEKAVQLLRAGLDAYDVWEEADDD